jgi:hypothetical protein
VKKFGFSNFYVGEIARKIICKISGPYFLFLVERCTDVYVCLEIKVGLPDRGVHRGLSMPGY